jgi:N-acetylglucosamine-6-phosphate deacetylase
MQRPLKIFNGKIITPDKIINDGCVLVADGTITAVNEKKY